MTEEPKPTQEEQDEAEPTRRQDPEIRCMSALLRMLNEIDEPARCRVVAWLAARYASQ